MTEQYLFREKMNIMNSHKFRYNYMLNCMLEKKVAVRRFLFLTVCMIFICILMTGCASASNSVEGAGEGMSDIPPNESQNDSQSGEDMNGGQSDEGINNPGVDFELGYLSDFDWSSIPEYSESAYYEINENTPFFTEKEKNTEVFEKYSELDALGRCGCAYANICPELIPEEERGEIGSIRPSGWQTVKYPDIIEDNYLYNRCHLIGYQLAGENDNELNLITGTRYLNVIGMLGFENAVYSYVTGTSNHVLYRVTPIFEGENLVASGVLMEAYSVEDGGSGICFNVYVYNVQPGIIIDYATGDSHLDETYISQNESGDDVEVTYILNRNSMKMHYPYCKSVEDMKEKNKIYFTGTREEAMEQGYIPCGSCKP